MYNLSDELYNHLKSSSKLFDFIQNWALEGLWLWQSEKEGKVWINPKLQASLKFTEHDLNMVNSFNEPGFYALDLVKIKSKLEFDGAEANDTLLVISPDLNKTRLNCRIIVAKSRECQKNLVIGAAMGIETQNETKTDRRKIVEVVQLAESVQDIIFTLDRKMRHTGVFGHWVERSGLTPDFFTGKTAVEILGPELAAPHIKANKKALNGEYVVYEWAVPT